MASVEAGTLYDFKNGSQTLIIVKMTIEEARDVLNTREMPDDAYYDIVQFLEEFDLREN
jgi:hypothetical protein